MRPSNQLHDSLHIDTLVAYHRGVIVDSHGRLDYEPTAVVLHCEDCLAGKAFELGPAPSFYSYPASSRSRFGGGPRCGPQPFRSIARCPLPSTPRDGAMRGHNIAPAPPHSGPRAADTNCPAGAWLLRRRECGRRSVTFAVATSTALIRWGRPFTISSSQSWATSCCPWSALLCSLPGNARRGR